MDDAVANTWNVWCDLIIYTECIEEEKEKIHNDEDEDEEEEEKISENNIISGNISTVFHECDFCDLCVPNININDKLRINYMIKKN